MDAAEKASMDTPIKHSLRLPHKAAAHSISELKIGSAYLWEDGTVRIYLGIIAKTGELLFYATGRMLLGFLSPETDGSDDTVAAHGDTQLNTQKMLANIVMSAGSPLDKSAVSKYTALPDIYGKIFDIYTPDIIKTWVKAHNWGFGIEFKEGADIETYCEKLILTADTK